MAKKYLKSAHLFCLLFALAGNIYGQDSRSDLWKNKVLYIGGGFGLGPIMGAESVVLGGNLTPLQLEWQMTRFLAIQTKMGFYFGPQTSHTAPKQTDPNSGIMETYSGTETHIIFPLLLKLTLRPNIFSFDVGGGIYVAPKAINTTVERTNDNGFTIGEAYGKNLFELNSANPFGFIAGASIGVKIDQGILFLDVSYLKDFSQTIIKFKGESLEQHLWNTIAINIGFKHGFFNFK